MFPQQIPTCVPCWLGPVVALNSEPLFFRDQALFPFFCSILSIRSLKQVIFFHQFISVFTKIRQWKHVISDAYKIIYGNTIIYSQRLFWTTVITSQSSTNIWGHISKNPFLTAPKRRISSVVHQIRNYLTINFKNFFCSQKSNSFTNLGLTMPIAAVKFHWYLTRLNHNFLKIKYPRFITAGNFG